MLVVPAHAKVNLALEVTGRRPDGWHEIATVIATIDWHDLIGIVLAPAAGGTPHITLRLTGPLAEGLPAADDNLAHRAADLLFKAAGQPPLDIHLWVCKHLPAAAGMGGGSADAAAVLRAGAATLRAHGHPVTADALHHAAEQLGSDVPAALHGGTVLATGRGEHLQPVAAPALHLAVAVAGASATAATYQALTDAERQQPDGRTTRLVHAFTTATPHTTPPDPALLGSALEPAATRAHPGLADALHRLRSLTPGTPWHLTGSGGAAFALARSADEAHHLAATARAAGYTARACRTLPHPHAAPSPA